jgi:hypothetical protein
MPRSSDSLERIAYFISSFLLFIWIVLRAIHIPIIMDENTTFHAFVETGKFTPFFSDWSSNNHFLNSALTTIFYGLFGDSLIILRMPNILASLLFFLFTWRLSQLLENRAIRWIFILSMLSTNGFVEYFSLCRGYGLSIAFLSGALYYLLRLTKTEALKYSLFSILFGTLALLSNFTFLVTIAFLLLFILLFFLQKVNRNISDSLIFWSFFILIGLAPLFLSSLILLKLNKLGMLYFGATQGFWNGTIQSLVDLALIDKFHPAYWYLAFLLLLMLAAIVFLCMSKRPMAWIKLPGFIVFIFLAGNFFTMIFMNRILGAKFPMWRTGLYFILLFYGSLAFLLDEAIADRRKYRFGILLLLLPLLFIPVQFIRHLSLGALRTHPLEIFDKDFYYTILAKQGNKENICSLSGENLYRGEWEFLNYTNDGTAGHLQAANPGEQLSDYLILYHNVLDSSILKSYKIIDQDPATNSVLLERIEKLYPSDTIEIKKVEIPEYINDTRLYLLRCDVDSLANRVILIDYSLDLDCPSSPFIGDLLIKVKGSDDRELYSEVVRLNFRKKWWDGTQGVLRDRISLTLPGDSHFLEIYLQNWNGIRFRIDKGYVMLCTAK